jgi:hypothetical protein
MHRERQVITKYTPACLEISGETPAVRAGRDGDLFTAGQFVHLGSSNRL